MVDYLCDGTRPTEKKLEKSIHSMAKDFGLRERIETSTSLWANKTVLIIDEIGMVSSKLMDSIDRKCRIAKWLGGNSTAVFGGMHVVILVGDFHRFLISCAKDLWQKCFGNE